MMSTDNKPTKQVTGDEGQTSGNRKATPTLKPPDKPVNCPRCDSPNTKFCYYNNYSLTQPRHFCKTCRRYWTKGGALRNVPIGGGCRKNKKTMKPSSSRLSGGDSGESSGGFKFFNGISPAMDFQMGGINFPRLHQSSTTSVYNYNQFPTTNPGLGLDYPSMGFNFPLPEMGNNSNIASSIESLSSINQDLHWKLQQQRLAVLFGGENQKSDVNVQNQAQKPQPILFQNLEISKPETVHAGDGRTEWFFDNNSYAPVNPTPANSSSTGNEMNSNNWSTGIQAWSTTNLNQYSPLP